MKKKLIQFHDNSIVASEKTNASRHVASHDEMASEENFIDFGAALRRVMGDEEFLWALYHEFIEGLPSAEKVLFTAIDKKDTATIVRQAYRLGSAAVSLGAIQFSEAAFKLEHIGREGKIKQADKALNRLLIEANRLVSHIEGIVSFPVETVAVS